MKIRNKENGVILEVNDKSRIEHLLGYPDKFEEIKEVKKDKKEIPVEEKQDEKSSKVIKDKIEE